MASIDEWKDYFQMVNGRDPSSDDLQHAIENGDVQLNDPNNGNSQNTVQAPAGVPTQAAQYPQPPAGQQQATMQPQGMPIQQPAYAYQPQTGMMMPSAPVSAAKKPHTVRNIIITIITVVAIIFGALVAYSYHLKTTSLASCQANQQTAQNNLKILKEDLQTIDEDTDDYNLANTGHETLTQSMLNDYQSAEKIANTKNPITSCASDDYEELDKASESNKEFANTAYDAIQMLRKEFPAAFPSSNN